MNNCIDLKGTQWVGHNAQPSTPMLLIPDPTTHVSIGLLSCISLSCTQSLDSDLSDGPITMQEYIDVKNALSASEAKIQHLMKANSSLSDELRLMQKKVSTALHQ